MKDVTIKTESLVEFYQRTGQPVPGELLDYNPLAGHFFIRQSSTIAPRTPYSRRDYFKICLCNGTGKGLLHYGEQKFVLDRPCLIFTNPQVPASIETSVATLDRYYCLFNDGFIKGFLSRDIRYTSPLFNATLPPVVHLSADSFERALVYFNRMQSLVDSSYILKWEEIRSLLTLLVHEGIHQQPRIFTRLVTQKDRIANGFFDLLSQHFPVHSPETPLTFLSPGYFAQQLHVHVNHLNSILKKQTGKTTRELIHERIVLEAQTLLQHTDWNVSQIAYALGFEEPSHFARFFKKAADVSPSVYRLLVTEKPSLAKAL